MLSRRRGAGRRGVTARPVLLALLPLFLLAACSSDDDDLARREDLRTLFQLRPIGAIPYPADNGPVAERVELGRLLFFDPVLSGEDDVSCGHCHHPAFAWGDGRKRAIGVSGEVPGIGPAGVGPERILTDPINHLETPRNSPTCLNTACLGQEDGEPHWLGRQFWDGRADGLEAQARLPIASFDEMRGFAYVGDDAMDMVLEELRGLEGYVQHFRQAFPVEAEEMDTFPERHVIREDTYARALAAYQRELVTLDSPFDRYLNGDDWALSEEAFAGMKLFFGEAGCGGCHAGSMLSTFEFSVTGVAQAGPGRDPLVRGGDGMDHGRWEHTEDPFDDFAFRVPPLRNVEITGPYMHTGEFATLEEVLDFYERGGNDQGLDPWRIDPRMEPVELTEEERGHLLAFLRSLTDRTIDSPYVDPTVPLSVPSGLTPPVPWEPFSRVPGGEGP